MNIFFRAPYIDELCQVSVHLAKGFERRRLKSEKFTDGRVMAIVHVAFGKVSYKGVRNGRTHTIS